MNILVHGDELDRFGVETAQNAEVVGGAVFFKRFGTVLGIGHDIGLRKAELKIAVLNRLNVDFGATG